MRGTGKPQTAPPIRIGDGVCRKDDRLGYRAFPYNRSIDMKRKRPPKIKGSSVLNHQRITGGDINRIIDTKRTRAKRTAETIHKLTEAHRNETKQQQYDAKRFHIYPEC